MRRQRLKRVGRISKIIYPVSDSPRICLIFVGTQVCQGFYCTIALPSATTFLSIMWSLCSLEMAVSGVGQMNLTWVCFTPDLSLLYFINIWMSKFSQIGFLSLIKLLKTDIGHFGNHWSLYQWGNSQSRLRCLKTYLERVPLVGPVELLFVPHTLSTSPIQHRVLGKLDSAPKAGAVFPWCQGVALTCPLTQLTIDLVAWRYNVLYVRGESGTEWFQLGTTSSGNLTPCVLEIVRLVGAQWSEGHW